MSRFRVVSVTGYNIGRQATSRGYGTRKPVSIWYVLDSANCYRIVSEHRNQGGRRYRINGERQAREHAAELERNYP